MPDPAVLDASALLAYLRDEPGAGLVADAIARGTTISGVNLAEVLGRAADRGADPATLADDLAARGLLHGAIVVAPFTAGDAVEVARLRSLTRSAGLSIGDRACLALARRLNTVAITADRAWGAIAADVAVRLTLIR
jgi:PIN domain nuclease of toxin-antitoxin system